jgi:ABC-type nickel/cobalt efflux system permease component RcnA
VLLSWRILSSCAALTVLAVVTAAHAAQPATLPWLVDGGWWVELVQYQGSLHRQLAGALRGLREGDPAHAAWVLGSLSLLYGVVHAIGPGHGKAVISSYLLADGQTIRSGIVLSFAAAAAQAVSAVAIVLVGSLIMGLAGFQLSRLAANAETASFALVTILGAGMALTGARQLARRFRAQPAHATHTHEHGGHEHHAGCGHEHAPRPAAPGRQRLLRSAGVVLAVGIRPCTGALIVLVFALVNGLILAGIASTLAMALGTAVTVSALAALSVQAKLVALRLFKASETRVELLTGWLWLGGGLAVAVLGVGLMLTPAPTAPF